MDIKTIKKLVSKKKYTLSGHAIKRKSSNDCVFCGGKVTRKKKRVDFWWGDKLSIFESVPVGVCEGCGEEYYDAAIVEKMEQRAMHKEKVIREIRVPVMSL